jgi:hypothetical protein
MPGPNSQTRYVFCPALKGKLRHNKNLVYLTKQQSMNQELTEMVWGSLREYKRKDLLRCAGEKERFGWVQLYSALPGLSR